MSLNIIGISALYHDASCCILQDGVLKAAAEEERFSRQKADPSMPFKAFQYCLKEAGLTVADVDCLAYYELPEKKLARQLWSGHQKVFQELNTTLSPVRAEQQIREMLGYEGPIKFVEHHLSHAASSFFYSGFNRAAILTVDGVGEWATTTYGIGEGNNIDLFEEVHFPDSLGLLYSTITSYLGFEVNEGEYKVMGLAPYGQPRYTDKIWKMLSSGKNGQYSLDMVYFDFLRGDNMYSEAIVPLFGQPVRLRGTEVTQFHQDVARSMQVVLEEILVEKATYLHQRTNSDNLCMAGGVALNCVANGRILNKGPFKRLFVQPAANDAGAALGAAALAHAALTGERPSHRKLPHVYLGPEYSNPEIADLLQASSLVYKDYRGNCEEMYADTAQKLAQGKVIGWFQGRMEFGPRSLGARSILADPRDPSMRDRINAMVKKREGFRPFAPAVLEEKMRDHFAIDHASPFMLETCQVISPLDLPAITHVDGSARVQSVSAQGNPRFAALIEAFERITNCPILLNTSFNVKGEPIVCDPEDAMRCFISANIDCLVMGDFVIDREQNTLDTMRAIMAGYDKQQKIKAGQKPNVYTFV
jgi:carbamoyltransferase